MRDAGFGSILLIKSQSGVAVENLQNFILFTASDRNKFA